MRQVTRFLPTAILTILASLLMAGCHGDSGEVRYVNKSDSAESITFNRARTVKTKLIYTFHGTSSGTYTLKTAKGTTSGAFSGDGERIKFRPEAGGSETVKLNSDGSFDFAHVSWVPAPQVMEKGLKAIASSKEGAAQ